MTKFFSSLLLLLCFAAFTFSQSPSPSPTPSVLGADKLGLNTPSPAVPLHFSVHYLVNTTASEDFIRVSAPNGHDPFGFYHRTTLFGDAQTNSVGFGFFPVGASQGAPSMVFLMEDNFGGGDNPDNAQSELHIQIAATDTGLAQRPWTWNFNRKTGAARVVTSAASQEFYSGANVIKLNPTEVLIESPLRVRSNSVSFETFDNSGAGAKQLWIVPYPSDSSTSFLRFGDSFGVGLAGVNRELHVVQNGNPGIMDAGSYKVQGDQVVSTRCAPISNTTDSKDDMMRAINEILACMRHHGLVATGSEFVPR